MRFFSTNKSNLISKFFAFSAIAATAILFSSCGKGTEFENPKKAYLTIVNASPTPATYNVYIDNSKVNPMALPYGGAFVYLGINPGQRELKFTTGSSTETIINKSLDLADQKNYSIFLLNKAPNLELLQVEDQLKAFNKGKAQLRFINLSQDAGEMGLVIKDDKDENVSFIENKAYKQSSDFIEIDAKTYSFQIKDKTHDAPQATIDKTEFKEGKIYTIMVVGLVTPGTNDGPLKAVIYSN